jgi:hypothetical protein
LIQRLLAFDYVFIALHDRQLFFRYSYCPQARGIAQSAQSVECFLRERNPICIVENGLPVSQCSLPPVLPDAGAINMDT